MKCNVMDHTWVTEDGKPCEESNRTAQMHPGRQYTIRDRSSISYIFHCSRMKKASARYSSACS